MATKQRAVGAARSGDIADRPHWMRSSNVPAGRGMHFAAFTYVGESVVDPGKYRNNVAGTLSLLEAIRDHVSNGVFSSTAANTTPDKVPIAETRKLRSTPTASPNGPPKG